jgi:hypothetical protein
MVSIRMLVMISITRRICRIAATGGIGIAGNGAYRYCARDGIGIDSKIVPKYVNDTD